MPSCVEYSCLINVHSVVYVAADLWDVDAKPAALQMVLAACTELSISWGALRFDPKRICVNQYKLLMWTGSKGADTGIIAWTGCQAVAQTKSTTALVSGLEPATPYKFKASLTQIYLGLWEGSEICLCGR